MSGLVRTSSGVSALAGMALISGLIVDGALAALFGAGEETDAFFVAAVIPFAAAALFAASANQALVPLFNTWHQDHPPDVAAARIGGVFSLLSSVGVLLALVGIGLAPILPSVIAPGAAATTREAAVPLAMVLFLTLATRIMAEALRALLNARMSFAAPAASPLWINICALISMVALSSRIGIIALPWGYLAGSVAQVAFLGVVARRRRIRVRLTWGLQDPEVRKGLRLLAWPTGSSALNIVARSFERFLASFLAVGSITIVAYAWRVLNAIGGTVFFRSVTVVLIPGLASVRHDDAARRRLVASGLRVMLAISVPLAVFLAVFAEPAIGVVFERGEFSAEMTAQLGSLLALYAITLPFVAVTRALLTLFYSRLDMVVPFQNRVINVAINTGSATALVWLFGVEGLALAYVAATIASLIHAVARSGTAPVLMSRSIVDAAVRVTAATFVAAAAARLAFATVSPADDTGKLVEAIIVGGSILGGMALVAVLYYASGASISLRPSTRPREPG